MEEQAIILAIQKLMESGAFEKLDQPGAQSFIIYALLIVLAMFSFRLFVINGSVKRFLRQERVDMPLDIFLERMQQLAAKEGLTLINCLTADGENDFSVLPALPPELESADEEDEDENEI